MSKFKFSNVTIVGLGVSGFSAAKLLKKLGAEVRITDRSCNESIRKRVKALKKIGIKKIEVGRHTKRFIKDSDFIIISPGVNKENNLLKEAKKRRIAIISEVELGFLRCKAPVIAITGTNGKTTTCTLIGQILKKAKYNPIICGNIGKPFCDAVIEAKSKDIIVLEVSSFQLEYIETFKPKIAMILNLDTDHLDYHKTIKEYFQAKARIYENQTKDDFSIFRKEDFKNRFLRNEDKIKSNTILISANDKADVYLDKRGYVSLRTNKRITRFIHISKINLEGVKSVENLLFAIALASVYKIDKETIIKVINSFKGLEHRMELVGVFKGVRYVNDSKATNVSATRLALTNINEPVILIAGGVAKGVDFSRINFKFLKNVKKIILFGESKRELAKRLKGIKPLCLVKDLEVAVGLAKSEAKEGDCILLSPMCASFDMFESYKERGRLFKELVKKLKNQLC